MFFNLRFGVLLVEISDGVCDPKPVRRLRGGWESVERRKKLMKVLM